MLVIVSPSIRNIFIGIVFCTPVIMSRKWNIKKMVAKKDSSSKLWSLLFSLY